ncbi:MAG: hypothetical protein KGL39_32080 [Patescibacteria group bacterium]|nr:hypothetical protein [Patescibacteria group bacterium]
MTKNAAGIGGKIEQLPCLGAFASMTGGGEIQRRHAREYGKSAHKMHDKLIDGIADADDAQIPLMDVSVPKRVPF